MSSNKKHKFFDYLTSLCKPSFVHTEIVIDRPIDEVWQALADFSRYPEWNSFLTEIRGTLAADRNLLVCAIPPKSIARRFSARILSVNEGHEFRWLGRFLFPGVLDGEHVFSLLAKGDRKTKFVHTEKFTGVITPIHSRLRLTNTRNGFIAMNEDLKRYVESCPYTLSSI